MCVVSGRDTRSLTSTNPVVKLLQQEGLRRGLTQQAVADRLETPQSFVAKYEGGERRLDVIEFIAVAKALEADPEELFRQILREQAQPIRRGRKTAMVK